MVVVGGGGGGGGGGVLMSEVVVGATCGGRIINNINSGSWFHTVSISTYE